MRLTLRWCSLPLVACLVLAVSALVGPPAAPQPAARETAADAAETRAIAADVDRSPVDLVLAPDESWLVVANETAGSLSLVQLPEGRVSAEVVCGGEADGPGWYLTPAVVAQVDNSMRIAREEIFGPVLSVIPFDDEADAVRIANDSEYGLSGTLWTRDLGRAVRVSQAVRTGVMSVMVFSRW